MTKIVGTPTPRVDAWGKVTGKAQYPGDMNMPNQAYMKILFANRPHAKILEIDTSKAEALDGVVAIFTAKDVPVNEYGLQIPDQPVLCGDVVRFVGDQVALIVAESDRIAAHARDLIEVRYEDLPLILEPREAMKPDSPLVHPERGKSNICVYDRIRKGDLEKGFAEADVIVEGEYQTPVQEHIYLQPEAGLAYLDEEGRVTVLVGGQWAHEDQEQIAHSLNLPEEQVRVIYPAIGGAFGGREDMSVQIVLALAAWKLKRPVKTIWSRQESIKGHGKRHPMSLRAKWGATKEGKLTAAEIEVVADAGAYMYTTNKVLGNSTITSAGAYFIPNIKSDLYGVYTNNLPGAAFRGFGAPQALFMAELQMEKLAAKLGMDPVELRRINALKDGDTLAVGTPPPSPPTVREVIDATAKAFGWDEEKETHPSDAVKRGRGFSCSFKNIGFSGGYQENSWARVELKGEDEIEELILYQATAEVGQGTHTAFMQIAAEAAGVPFEKVRMVTSDTALMGNSGSVSASRMTFMGGNAVKGAAERARAAWDKGERPAEAEYTYLAPKTTPFDKDTGYSMPNFAYAYAAQAMEIEVDTETGAIKILRVVAGDDLGKAINPQQVEGQIEGAVVQAQGYTMMENYQTKDGYVLSDQLSTYLIPTIWDIPEKLEIVMLEKPHPEGPWGARGVGEPPFLSFAPAFAAALHDATGVWFNDFPLTPERVLRGLGKI